MSAVTPLAARTSPYQGLTAYTARDRGFFFGREHETRIIVANLLATRLTLIYGASGVGKSSLMCAGVVPRLRELAEEGIRAGHGPECVVAVFPAEANEDDLRRASWQDDPIEGIADAIECAVAALGLEVEPPTRTHNLATLLAAWTQRIESDVLLVLDQFEEYFLYHGDEDGEGTLAAELPRALSQASLAANVAISIREDAYTRLDRFKGRLSILYDNYLRVEHLSREGARAAIVSPLEKYNELERHDAVSVTVEDELVEAVLEQVQSGAVALGQAGRGSVTGDTRDGAIETPFLQLVMERLWSAEREAGSNVLRLETLERLGGARRIVRTHLDQAMATLDADDEDICARVFGRLVTPSRTKIAYLAADLAKLENVAPERLSPVLEDLAAKRILRPIAPPPEEILPRYEIFHDVLAPAVLDWRGRWLQAQEHTEAERKLKADLDRQAREREEAEAQAERERHVARRRRRVAAAAIVLAVLAVVLAALAAVAWRRATDESRTATTAKRHAQASELLTLATSALATDPTHALSRAEAAVRAPGGPPAAPAIAALREAVRTSALVAVLHRRQAVRAAGFGPSGARLFTVAGDRLDLWDARTGRHLAGVRAPHGEQLLDAAFSSDGAALVAGANDGRTLLWRPPAPRLQPLLGRAHGPVLRVAYSQHGHRVLAASDDNAMRIWSLASKHPAPMVRRLYSTPTAASFSADGRRVLTASLDGAAAIWSARTGRRLQPLGHDARAFGRRSLRAAAFSPDGRLVVTGSDTTDGTGFPVGYRPTAIAQVWTAATGRKGSYIRTHAAITSLAVSHSGRRIVAGTADGSAQIWRPSQTRSRAKVLLSLRGHTDQVSSVAFSPDDRWVVTASGDGSARIWNAATGTLLAQLRGHGDWVGSVAFSPRGDRILTASDDGTARLWRLPVERPAVTFHSGIVESTPVVFDDLGEHALLVTPDRSAQLSDAGTGRYLRTFDRYRAGFAALSPDGARVLTADPGHIATWDTRKGRKVRSQSLRITIRPVTSADGRWITIIVGDRVRMWDAQTGRLSRTLEQPRGAKSITAVALNRDGTHAAAARADRTVTVWDTTTRSIVRTIRHAELTSVALSPDGSELVGSRRTTLFEPTSHRADIPWLRRSGTTTTAWSTRTGRRLFVLRSHDAVTVQRFSPDGRLVVTAGDENAARVWDARTGRKLTVLRGHTGPLHDAEFSQDSRLVVTASEDGTARVWNARTGEVLTELAQGARGAALSAAFDRRGGGIVVGSGRASAIYRCSVCGGARELLARADQLEPRSSG
jgi:WD40 repeat protein